MTRYMQQLACRFHPDATLIEDYRAGDMICPMCGLVVGERMIDVSSEWRNFGNESDTKSMDRVGAAENLLYDHINLETTTSIGTGAAAVDEFGRQKYRNKIGPVSSADKTLRNGHDAIRIMAGRINLAKKVVNRAFEIFQECHVNKCLRGYSQDAIVTTCIYTACRNEDSPRAMKEICGISTISVKELGRCFSKLKQRLPKVVAHQSVGIKNLIPRFCNDLQLEQEKLVQKTAIYIGERADEFCDIQGRQPSSIAAAAIYLACLVLCENKTKKDIEGRTSVSESVIRDIYKIMLPHAPKLFPENFVFKRSIANLPAI